MKIRVLDGVVRLVFSQKPVLLEPFKSARWGERSVRPHTPGFGVPRTTVTPITRDQVSNTAHARDAVAKTPALHAVLS
jgi:hypothetical protein